MSPDEAAAIAAIHATFAIPIDYLTPAVTLSDIGAVKSDNAAGDYAGAGATKRSIAFELLQTDVPERPGRDCRIRERESGRSWRVTEVTRRDDVGAWDCTVESLGE